MVAHYTHKSPQPKITRPYNPSKALPKDPGRYFWDAWGCYVDVYKKRNSRYLYVTPPVPGGVEVRISPRIAGNFIPAKDQGIPT